MRSRAVLLPTKVASGEPAASTASGFVKGKWFDGRRAAPALLATMSDEVHLIIHADGCTRLVLLGKSAGHPEVIAEL